MTNKNKSINVRFDNDLYEAVEKVAAEKRISKSDVVRQAIGGELSEINNQKSKSLSDAEREKLMKGVGRVLSNLSIIKRNLDVLGNNTNQIAKHLNQRNVPNFDEKSLNEVLSFKDNHIKSIDSMSKAVDMLWRMLV